VCLRLVEIEGTALFRGLLCKKKRTTFLMEKQSFGTLSKRQKKERRGKGFKPALGCEEDPATGGRPGEKDRGHMRFRQEKRKNLHDGNSRPERGNHTYVSF